MDYDPTQQQEESMQIGTNQKPSRKKVPDMVLRLSESTSTPLSHPCYKFGLARHGGKNKPPVKCTGGKLDAR